MSEDTNSYSADFLECFPRGYGLAWRQVKPDFTRCAALVVDGGRMVTSSQCARKNGHGPHGAYCKQHDPVARSAKRDAADRARRAQWDAEARARQFSKDAQQAVKMIAAGHNDPRGFCLEILARFEAPE